ncbi:AEC family transporter [Falsirhodobacter sp. 20TX0035]|uniref:AEC family transporter n=1 Tax=Falsirhodobacter sp. 20TX0035 TaxID=3022019 RepID=UPI00232A9A8C|nr:AEC family transporter [Falsirhodobacter sp. 20TX0035]MDB6454019.1 AEC family transporter [Falsirhodobacter sp. 20TX0035]
MLAILSQLLPFFALIGLGYAAVRRGFFSEDAIDALTRFVFWFALTAMLFHFSSELSLGQIFDWPLAGAYLVATGAVNLLALTVARLRGEPLGVAVVEAQTAVIGNTGFLGIPLLVALLGREAVAPMLMMLTIDLAVFGSLFTILITLSRSGRMSAGLPRRIGRGLVTNPMLVALALGLAWSATGWTVPGPADRTLTLLSAAATPGALFAIGGSLAARGLDRVAVGGWLSFAKLVLHPAAVALALLAVGRADGFAAQVMIATAALPVAGNVYMLAQHYGVAPYRVSTAILMSTLGSLVTLTATLVWTK